MIKNTLLAILCGLTAMACRQESPVSSPEEPANALATGERPALSAVVDPALQARAHAQGTAIVARAFSLLSSNLQQALQKGGITNALQFCSVHALPLTALAVDTNEVVLQRVSHKARNPQNRADPGEMAVLGEFQRALSGGRALAPQVRSGGPGLVSFYAPIVVNNPLCLNCHGRPQEDIVPEHLALLAELYPQDQATGFQLGDLRGLWRVDFRQSALEHDAR